jgi:hypothetical protein
MSGLPNKVRITNMGWSESCCSYKVQIGDIDRTIAYAWVAGGSGDRQACYEAMQIATRICEGWNVPTDDVKAELLAALEECAEFLDGYVDVVDGDYGVPEPNAAMRLMQTVKDAIAKAEAAK